MIIGQTIFLSHKKPLVGCLVCNNAVVKKTDYPELYSVIGDTWHNHYPWIPCPPDSFVLPNMYPSDDRQCLVIVAKGDHYPEFIQQANN